MADFLSTAGANRVVTVDLHAGQIQGFFNCPVDNLFASQVLLEPFMSMKGEIVVVSPDAGGVERARSFAKRIEAPLAIIDKRRDRPNQATATHVIGDVDGKIAVLVDDIIDTAGTICAGAEVLLREGAREVYACATTRSRPVNVWTCARSCRSFPWPAFSPRASTTSTPGRP